MTFEEWLASQRGRHLQVIIEERSRYTYAQKLFEDYQLRMGSLKLKALTWLEINDRLRELEIIEGGLDDEYSDTEDNRARFEDWQQMRPAP